MTPEEISFIKDIILLMIPLVIGGYIVHISGIKRGKKEKELEYDRIKKTLRDETYLKGQLEAYHFVFSDHGQTMLTYAKILGSLIDGNGINKENAKPLAEQLEVSIDTVEKRIAKEWEFVMFIDKSLMNKIDSFEKNLYKLNFEILEIINNCMNKPITQNDLDILNKNIYKTKLLLFELANDWKDYLGFR